jgi:diamine N-acetyltransferase
MMPDKSKLYLREITKENWEECITLSVSDEQSKFIASNLYSLAQSKFEPEMCPLGIYFDDHMVGFIMYVKDSKAEKVWIVRFMTDKAFQRKGYGKMALDKFIEMMREKYAGSDIFLCVEPENQIAIRFYESFDFALTGEKWDNELVYCRRN